MIQIGERLISFVKSFGLGRETPIDNTARDTWQNTNARIYEEATRNPEMHTVRKDCSHNCGWWTMATVNNTQPELADQAVASDIQSHLFHNCPEVTPKEKAKMRSVPQPSH